MVFAVLLRVVRIRAELGVDERDVQLLLDDVEQVTRRRAAIDVRAHDVEVWHVLRDQIDEAEVTVCDRDGVVVVDFVNRVRDLAVEGVQEHGAGIALIHVRQVFDFRRRPVEAVVVFVAEQPHQHARHVLEVLCQLNDVSLDDFSRSRVGVVRRVEVDAIDVVAVPTHRVIEDRVDPILLVDVRDPFGRHARVHSDRVDAHLLHERHLVIEGLLNEVVRLPPEVVSVVFARREVVPVHAEDEEVLPVDLQLPSARIFDGLDHVDAAGSPRRCRWCLSHGGCRHGECGEPGRKASFQHVQPLFTIVHWNESPLGTIVRCS